MELPSMRRFSIPLLALVLHGMTIQANAQEKRFPPQRSERKLAMLIGNQNYDEITDLINPRNDAEDLAALLRTDLGFPASD
jgi:regulator of sirC expression with transglutaminase-like and TPR domain